MDDQRRQAYLDSLLQRRAAPGVRELAPLVNRWNDVLAAVPGLHRRHPGAHCRLCDLSAGVLTVEADHPAWLQLLQWHETEIVARVATAFPALSVSALRFRLSRPGDRVERPTVVMPDPVKPELSEAEQTQLDGLLAELEGMIARQSPDSKKPD